MKNKLKGLFKELTIFHYIGFGAVILILMVFTLLSFVQNNDKNNFGKISKNDDTDIGQLLNNQDTTVYYSEGDEDGAYNYIINGTDLINNNSEMPYY